MQAIRGWHALRVRTYGQYCPIARASDLLAERWSIIILRNILIGCRTFNEIADGAPGLSRGLLSKRLRELERAGVVEICPKPDGPGSYYGREIPIEFTVGGTPYNEKEAEIARNAAPVSARSR